MMRAYQGESSNLDMGNGKEVVLQQIEHGDHSNDVYNYLSHMEKEEKRRPVPNYIEQVQNDVTPIMRGVLVDWLVEVLEEYHLEPNTLYLSIYYIDKFLSINCINKMNLQLLGVSSMFVAAKYEGNRLPSADELCCITDNTYRKEDLMKMEADILKCLQFEVSTPTVLTFLRRFDMVSKEDLEDPTLLFEPLESYLAELSLVDYDCVKFLPSMIASSVIFLSRFIIQPNNPPWITNLERYTGYKSIDLKDCVLILHQLRLGERECPSSAIRKKYIMQHKFKHIGLMPCPLEIPNLFFEEMTISG